MASVMFKVFFAILFVFLVSSVRGQWDDPAVLGDTMDNNTNPYLSVFQDNDVEQLHLFWERWSDSTATALWHQELLHGNAAAALLSTPGVHYTHPVVVETDYFPADTLYIMYQTDEAGNQDIYYLKLSSGGYISDPIPFATTPEDETQLNVASSGFLYDYWYSNDIAWIQGGKVMHCFLYNDDGQINFTEPLVIDSGNCTDPVFRCWTLENSKVLWIRNTDSSAFIYQSEWDYDSGWSEPEIFYNGGNCVGLTDDKAYNSYLLAFSTEHVDSFWSPIGVGRDDVMHGTEYYFQQTGPPDVAIREYLPNSKNITSALYMEGNYLACTYPVGGNNEIFLNENPYIDDYYYLENFSNLGCPNRNPEFFLGESTPLYCWYNYLLWEAYEYGHWKIYHSRDLNCLGGLNEHSSETGIQLSLSPNPARESVRLEYTLNKASEVRVTVTDSRGVIVYRPAPVFQEEGTHSWRLDLVTDNSLVLTSGVYHVTVEAAGMRVSSGLLVIK
ncbi:MAG: hypothetical protein KKA81_08380 [Bacteroidetes bacterium]|nr:hypothetical protein [Bacteroidota bacterium]